MDDTEMYKPKGSLVFLDTNLKIELWDYYKHQSYRARQLCSINAG